MPNPVKKKRYIGKGNINLNKVKKSNSEPMPLPEGGKGSLPEYLTRSKELEEIINSNKNRIQITITNNKPEPKTYLLGGGDTGLSEVEDNIPYNTDVNLFATLGLPGNPGFYTISGNSAYVSGTTGVIGYVAIVDLTTGAISQIISIPAIPGRIAQAGNYLYVVAALVDYVMIIDLTTDSYIGNITPDPSYTSPLGIISYNGYVYFSLRSNGAPTAALAVIDSSTNTIIQYIAQDPDTNDMFNAIVYNGILYTGWGTNGAGQAKIVVINPSTNTLVSTTELTYHIATNLYGYGDYIYTISWDGNVVGGLGTIEVFQISTGTIVTIIPCGYAYGLVEYDGFIYVGDYSNSEVLKIDTSSNTIVNTLPITGGPYVLSIINNFIYAGLLDDNDVSVIDADTFTIVDTIPVGVGPTFTFVTDPYTFIINSGGSSITVLSTDSTTPVTLAVNGNQTLDQFNNEISKNPICIEKLSLDVTDRTAFNIPFEKKLQNATGTIDIASINLLQKFSAYNSANVNYIELKGEDFNTALLNGVNYIEHEIPGNSTINIVIDYCQLVISDTLSKDKVMMEDKRGEHGYFPLPDIKEKDRRGFEHLEIRFINDLSTPKTYRLGGLDTGLPEVSGNDPYNLLSQLQSEIICPGIGPARYLIDGNLSYVTITPAGVTDYISVVDLSIATLLHSIPVEPGIGYIAKSGNYLYAPASSQKVLVVDLINKVQLTSIPFQAGYNTPNAISEFNGFVYASVANVVLAPIDFLSFAKIDTSTNTIVSYIPLNPSLDSPVAMKEIILHNNLFYCSVDGIPAQLKIFDPVTDTLLSTIDLVGDNPQGMIIDGDYIYIGMTTGGLNIYQISTNTLVTTIAGVGDVCYGLQVYNGFLYVASFLDDKVSKIDLSSFTIVDTLSITGGPGYISLINNYLYVSLITSGEVSVVDADTFTVVETIVCDSGSFQTYTYDNYTYIHNSNFNTITVLTTTSTTPVIVTINGTQSLSQFNNEIAKNPIMIEEATFDSTDRTALNNPILKKESTGTGLIEVTRINLLDKYTAFNSPNVNVIDLDKKDLVSPVLDGANYLEHTIPGNSTIVYNLFYKQEIISDHLKGPNDGKSPIENRSKKGKKKYQKAKFRLTKR